MALCKENQQGQLANKEKSKKKKQFDMQLSNENKAAATLC